MMALSRYIDGVEAALSAPPIVSPWAHSTHCVGFVSRGFGPTYALLDAAAARARASSFFFGASRWAPTCLKPEESLSFTAVSTYVGIAPATVLPHASYLINLASGDAGVREMSYAKALNELQCCASLGLPSYNLHAGSATLGVTRAGAIAHLASALNRLHLDVPNVITVIETMASGKVLGASLSDLCDIIEAVHDKCRIGVCIDTAHCHGAGVDLATPGAWGEYMTRFIDAMGLQYLKGLHLNDSKAQRGEWISLAYFVRRHLDTSPLYHRLKHRPSRAHRAWCYWDRVLSRHHERPTVCWPAAHPRDTRR